MYIAIKPEGTGGTTSVMNATCVREDLVLLRTGQVVSVCGCDCTNQLTLGLDRGGEDVVGRG